MEMMSMVVCREAGGKQAQRLQEAQSELAKAQAQLALKDASNRKYKVLDHLEGIRCLLSRSSSECSRSSDIQWLDAAPL